MTLKEEQILKSYVKGLIREAFETMASDYMRENDIFEKKSKTLHKKKSKTSHKKKSKTPHKKREINKETMMYRRRAVIDALDTEKNGQGEIKLDVAPYAYALWPDKDKDSARSYFYKCLKNELNDSGVPYEFSDAEINHLYSMISNNSM